MDKIIYLSPLRPITMSQENFKLACERKNVIIRLFITVGKNNVITGKIRDYRDVGSDRD